jgi:hypothetical protein
MFSFLKSFLGKKSRFFQNILKLCLYGLETKPEPEPEPELEPKLVKSRNRNRKKQYGSATLFLILLRNSQGVLYRRKSTINLYNMS